jgi:hypothetical protein
MWKHVKYLLFLSGFNNRFSKKVKIHSSIKIRPVGAEMFHADRQTDGRTDRQTDVTKLIVAFRYSANTPKTTTGPGRKTDNYYREI